MSDPILHSLELLVYQNMIIGALQLVRTEFQLSLKDAISFLQWLELHLRHSNPAAFELPPEQYWSGFYS